MPKGKYVHARHKITFRIDNNNCHLCTSHALNRLGYPTTQVNGKHHSLHRYVYEQVYGKQPSGVVIRHTCDNPKCINIEHLVPGTRLENSEDMVNRNRSARGMKNAGCKLTDQSIKEIRNSPLSTYKLAIIYGVSRQNIGFIKSKKTWKHI